MERAEDACLNKVGRPPATYRVELDAGVHEVAGDLLVVLGGSVVADPGGPTETAAACGAAPAAAGCGADDAAADAAAGGRVLPVLSASEKHLGREVDAGDGPRDDLEAAG